MSTKITMEKINNSTELKPATDDIHFICNNEDLNFKVNTFLTLENFAKFVHSVSDACFTDDSYCPYFKDIMMKRNIMKYFANLELPDSIEEINEVIYRTDLIEKIISSINSDQFSALTKSIDEEIEFRKSKLVAREKTTSDELVNQVATTLGKISGLIDTLKNALGSFDIDHAAEIIKSFSPEELNMLTGIKDLRLPTRPGSGTDTKPKIDIIK